MKPTQQILVYLVVLSAAVPAFAQRGSQVPAFVKAVTRPVFTAPAERLLAPVERAVVTPALQPYLAPQEPFEPLTYTPPHIDISALPEAVSLSDGKGKTRGKHSIVPSASTILGSDAFKTAQSKQIDLLRQQAEAAMNTEYLTPNERAYWITERETLHRLWRTMSPADKSQLPAYLAHPVPPETLADLTQSYIDFAANVQQANHEVMTKIIYSSLQGEGKGLSLPEKIYINKIITDIRFNIVFLRNAFVKDPYLIAQQKYWNKVFSAFNPLLEGLLLKLDIPRPDKRVYDYHEFVLSNPDHTTPYLPDSHSLIKGEKDEDDDYDDYEDGYDNYGRPMPAELRAAQRAAEQAHYNKMMQFTQEKDELLTHIPENLRIAFINDDANPRLNMESWAKKGYLGKGATVETFKEGGSFLDKVKNGTHYDLVITDLLVTKGGIIMMEELRDLAPFLPVIASSKFYPGDGDTIKTEDGKEVTTAEDYFHAGIDGYMWYNNNLDAGSYGYIQYLRSMKNYYYYKNLHGWAR